MKAYNDYTNPATLVLKIDYYSFWSDILAERLYSCGYASWDLVGSDGGVEKIIVPVDADCYWSSDRIEFTFEYDWNALTETFSAEIGMNEAKSFTLPTIDP